MNKMKFVCIFVGMLFCFAPSARAEISEQIAQQIEYLKSPNIEVRHQAFQALAEFGKPAVLLLVAALEKEQSPEVIHGIVYALGNIGDKTAVPCLFRLLENKDGNVAIYATEALCSMGDETVIFDLMKFAEQKAKSVDKDKVEKMAQELKEQNADGMARLEAAASVMQIPMNIAAGMQNAGEAIVPTVFKALKNKDYEVRLFAAGLLRGLCTEAHCENEAIESFIDLLADNVAEVRRAAVESLVSVTGKDFGENRQQWQEWREQKTA